MPHKNIRDSVAWPQRKINNISNTPLVWYFSIISSLSIILPDISHRIERGAGGMVFVCTFSLRVAGARGTRMPLDSPNEDVGESICFTLSASLKGYSWKRSHLPSIFLVLFWLEPSACELPCPLSVAQCLKHYKTR